MILPFIARSVRAFLSYHYDENGGVAHLNTTTPSIVVDVPFECGFLGQPSGVQIYYIVRSFISCHPFESEDMA